MSREVVVILDNIRSALNVGAIMRTCDGAGVKKMCLCGITPDKFHRKISKTALGAEEYIETEHFRSTKDAILKYKSENYKIYSVEQTQNSINYFGESYPDKLCLIFGNEITGVSTEVLVNSDKTLEVPMSGKKNSLNVATTAGIVIYHVIQSERI
jgi:23S rRNA (guanosine2251-2'-O)-methyltransferase